MNNLRYELQAEIERAKGLSAQRPPDSVSRHRGRVLSQNEDPKMAEVVRFYEDLTNLLVTDIKPQPARHLQQEDWHLTCVYSHQDVTDTGSTSAKSMLFSAFVILASLSQLLHFYQACLSDYDSAMRRSLISKGNQRTRTTSLSHYSIPHLNWKKRLKNLSIHSGFSTILSHSNETSLLYFYGHYTMR